MADKIQTQKIICKGGLHTSNNNLLLSDELPGSASRLINYEVSLAGGYRRINGFSKFDVTYYNVDDAAAEGPILGLAMYRTNAGSTEYLAARKQQSGTTYNWYKFQSGVGWVAQTTGLTLNTTTTGVTLNRIRSTKFNFGTGNQIVFADGVNNATIYDGTTWYHIDPADTGADLAHSGGATAIAAPSFVEVYENHLFMGGSYASPNTIAHSGPRLSYTWTSAAGGGQIIADQEIIMIKPFRETNYLFAEDAIQKVTVDSSGTFVLDSVTNNIGCLAADSIVEIGGDLLFLSPDGFRPVAGTAKIGDIEIESVSKDIQLLTTAIIKETDLTTMNAVVLRTKSQVRFFYGGTNGDGLIAGLRTGDGGVDWEWGQLKGIESNIAISDFVSGKEIVLHGDTSGNIFIQESGNSFNGEDILGVYSPPFLDQSDTEVRKRYRTLSVFTRPEGDFTLNLALDFDWGSADSPPPSDYAATSEGIPAIYGGLGVVYGGVSTYGGAGSPVLRYDIEGEAFSIRPSFVSLGTEAPHSIQGFVMTITPLGRI